jgi:hypothetical protein
MNQRRRFKAKRRRRVLKLARARYLGVTGKAWGHGNDYGLLRTIGSPSFESVRVHAEV